MEIAAITSARQIKDELFLVLGRCLRVLRLGRCLHILRKEES